MTPIAKIVLLTLTAGSSRVITPDDLWVDLGDDLVRVEFILALEEQLEIELLDDEAEGVRTVGDLIRLAEKRVGVGVSA